MKTYTIDTDDNITAFASAKEAEGAGERFASAKELAKLAEGWPVARLVAIWNSLPGGEPVKRFQSRQAAVTRIWAAIQRLEPTPAAGTARHRRLEDGLAFLAVALQYGACLRFNCSLGKPTDFDHHSGPSSSASYFGRPSHEA